MTHPTSSNLSLIVLLILCIALPNFSGTGDHERQSVTTLSSLLFVGERPEALSPHWERYLLDTTRSALEMPRFDLNPLGTDNPIVSEFVQRSAALDLADAEALASLLEQTVAQQIIQIIDDLSMERAGERVDDVARMSMAVTKAKTSGVTVKELEGVMNSGYISVPFIRYFLYDEQTVKEAVDGGSVDVTYSSVRLGGGVLWFHIDRTGPKTRIEPVIVLDVNQDYRHKKDTKVRVSRGVNISGPEYAFRTVANHFADQLGTKTRGHEAFQLRGVITAARDDVVSFNLGLKEGIKLDDRFTVGEYVMSASGEKQLEERGFYRVKSIGDNRDPGNADYSLGYGVIVEDWAPGMTIKEYPTYRADFRYMLGMFGLDFEGQDPIQSEDQHALEPIALTSLSSGPLIGIGMEYHTQKSNLSYLIASMGLHKVFLQYDRYGESFEESPLAFFFEFGYSKRLQFQRIGAYATPSLAVDVFSFKGEEDEEDFDTAKWTNIFAGLGIQVGLDYTININSAVGIFASSYFGVGGNEWQYHYKLRDSSNLPTEETEIFIAEGPSTQRTGYFGVRWISSIHASE